MLTDVATIKEEIFDETSSVLPHTNWFYLLLRRVLLATPAHQNILILSSSFVLAVFVLSGLLLYRQYDPSDLIKRGDWYMHQGKAVLATHQFERLVRNHPNSYEGYFRLGRAYLEINAPDKAANAFARAAQLAGGDATETKTVVALSEYIIAKGDYAKAETVLLNALKTIEKAKREDKLLNQALVSLYTSWGDSLTAKEDLEGQEVDYEKAFNCYLQCMAYVSTSDEQLNVRKRLSETLDKVLSVYVVNQETKKAEEVLEKVLKYEKNPVWMKSLGDLIRKDGQLDKAIVWYQRAYSLNPSLTAPSLIAAIQEQELVARSKGDAKSAEKFFDSALKIAKANGLRIRPAVGMPEKTGIDSKDKASLDDSKSGDSKKDLEKPKRLKAIADTPKKTQKISRKTTIETFARPSHQANLKKPSTRIDDSETDEHLYGVSHE